MNGAFFHFDTVETPARSVKVRFESSFASSNLADSSDDALLYFEEFFNRHMAKGYLHFELDLQDIAFPPTRFIALLIALTVRARRRQGEVKLVNVSPTARNNFSTFSALNFLTIEHEALSASKFQAGAFSAKEKTATPSPRAPASNKIAPSPSAMVEDDLASLAEIAEPPLIEQMAEKIVAPAAAPTEKKFQLRVESRTTNLYQLCDFVTAHAFAAGVHEKEIAKIKIAVYEACLNVIEHAYHSRPDEWIELHVHYSAARFMIVIQDNGISFEMKPPKDYDVNEVIDERRSGGFGLHIIRRAMDSVEYLPDSVNGNRLVMVKKLM
jgi:anti-sigma regulatory factor (Ser/Thr protein kinase)